MGDSNPRYLAVYTLSKRAPSTTRPTLRGDKGIDFGGKCKALTRRTLGTVLVEAALFLEEAAQEGGAAVVADAPRHGEAVVEPSVRVEIVAQAEGAPLGIVGSKGDPRQPGLAGCRQAHGAGFEGGQEVAARQPPATQLVCRLDNGENFGVAAGVVGTLLEVVSFRQNLAVPVGEERPHGNLVLAVGFFRLL